MAYNLFKFLHVAGVIVWIGSVTTLTLLNLRLARDTANGAGAVTLAHATGAFGRTVVGPAAGLTLLAGIGTSVVGGLDMGALWITWGFTAILISMVLGMTALRRTTTALEAALVQSSSQVGALRGRLTSLNLVNLLVLLSAVGAMVFKPTL
jgi:uncharacterized membrane protein